MIFKGFKKNPVLSPARECPVISHFDGFFSLMVLHCSSTYGNSLIAAILFDYIVVVVFINDLNHFFSKYFLDSKFLIVLPISLPFKSGDKSSRLTVRVNLTNFWKS